MKRPAVTVCLLCVSLLFVIVSQVATTLTAAEPLLLPHADPNWFVDEQGQKQPVRSVKDWELRRTEVLRQMQTVMGPLPSRDQLVPLDVKIEEEDTTDGLVRRKISYHTDSADRRVKAWLYLPEKKADGKLPAMLCLHQTTGIGKGEPAGLGGLPNLHYALHLAKRGYVTLAPDYPSFGEYPCEFKPEDGYISGTMRAINDNRRAVDVLQSLSEVHPERIGCIGHSLGGHNTMFTAVFEPRIKVMVSSCGFTRFHKYYGGALKGWTSPRYMPLINDRHHNNPDEVPFDFPEIVAAFAPRPFFTNSPIGDGNFEVSGVRDTIAAAQPVYRLFDAEENLKAVYPDCGHDFPEAAREQAYQFIDRHLKTTARQ